MNICISGATGFIGNKLLQHHLALGHNVRYLTRSVTTNIPGAQAYVGDLTNTDGNLTDFLDGADIFYHCAGEVSDENKMRETHVIGTHCLLDALTVLSSKVNKPIHWIQLSSCGAYGQSGSASKTTRMVDEYSEEVPNGEYEVTKTESDRLVMAFAKDNSKFRYTIIRPTIVFGMGMRSTAIKRLVSIIQKGVFFYVRDKETIANYVHVDDVVGAMVLSAQHQQSFNQIFIVSNDCKYKSMVDVIADVLNVNKPWLVVNERVLRLLISILGRFVTLPISHKQVDVMVRKTTYSAKKIQTLLGWQPSAPAQNQMQQYVKETVMAK